MLAEKIREFSIPATSGNGIAICNTRNFDLLFSQLLSNRTAVIPFVGAGISAYPFADGNICAYPQWKQLLTDTLPAILFPSDEKGYVEKRGSMKIILCNKFFSDNADWDFEGAASHVEQEFIRHYPDDRINKFDTSIKTVLSLEKLNNCSLEKLRGSLHLMPELFEGGVITTNYDQVIEYTYRKYGWEFPNRRIITPKSYLRARHYVDFIKNNIPRLVKLHGDIDDPSTRVITISEYDSVYGKKGTTVIKTDFVMLLRALFTRKTILFIGCSLEKDRTLSILSEAMQGETKHYTIINTEASNELTIKKNARLLSMGINPIWYNAKEHGYGVVDELLNYFYGRIHDVIQKENR